MNVSKKSFIAFAVLACCFGASTLGTHVDASYGYKYTDSVRPPVETPTMMLLELTWLNKMKLIMLNMLRLLIQVQQVQKMMIQFIT